MDSSENSTTPLECQPILTGFHSLVWTLSHADSSLCFPVSTGHSRHPSPTAFLELLCPTLWLAFPSYIRSPEISSPKPFVRFRAKTDKGIVCLADHLHSVTLPPGQKLVIYLYFKIPENYDSVSWWFTTEVWVTENLLKSPGLFSEFWPISIMLSFKWSPLVLLFPIPLVPVTILWWLYRGQQLQLVSLPRSCSIAFQLSSKVLVLIAFFFALLCFLSVLPCGQPDKFYIRQVLFFKLSLTISRRCLWCNGYRRRKWTRRHEFKSWTRLIAFHIALIPAGKVWIQLFSLQLWVNSRTDWVLQPWWSN